MQKLLEEQNKRNILLPAATCWNQPSLPEQSSHYYHCAHNKMLFPPKTPALKQAWYAQEYFQLLMGKLLAVVTHISAAPTLTKDSRSQC